MFEKQSGSPRRFRTYDPVVYSPGVKCFVFSGHISMQAAFRRYETLLRKRKSGFVQSASAVCFFAYFCCCNGNCGAMCCSCRRSLRLACKGFSRVCVRWVREIAAASALIGFVDCGPQRASGESQLARYLKLEK